MKLKTNSTILCVVIALSATATGCSVFVPYNENFACEGSEDYGKCVSVSGAYKEAVTGEAQGVRIGKDGKAEEPTAAASPTPKRGASAEYGAYRTQLYRELETLISDPVTPMVKQPRVVRTLILNYGTEEKGKPLFMPRYVFWLAEDPHWVLTDYLTTGRDRIKPMLRRD